MLSIQKVSLKNATYYLALAQEDYYLNGGEPPGQWHGQGARAMGLAGVVKPDQFHDLFRGFSPVNQEPLVQNAGQSSGYHQRCPGWDLTFSAPKTVSVCWALAPEETRKLIEAAHNRAVRVALDRMEEIAGVTRRGPGGRIQEQASLCYALFEHGTSRAQDPQLHTHAICFNLAFRADGTTGAVRSNSLFESKMAVGALYRSELAAILQRELGFAIEKVESWFEIRGVKSEVAAEFSTRRQQILQFCEEQGKYGALEAQTAALATREVKHHVAREALFAHWQEVGRQFGWDQSAVLDLTKATPNHETASTVEGLRHDATLAMEQASKRSVAARNGQRPAHPVQHTATRDPSAHQAGEVLASAASPSAASPPEPGARKVSGQEREAEISAGEAPSSAPGQESGSASRQTNYTAGWGGRWDEEAAGGSDAQRSESGDQRASRRPFAVVRVAEQESRYGPARFKLDLRFVNLEVRNRLIAQNAPRWSPLHGRSLPVFLLKSTPDPFELKTRVSIALERTRFAAARQIRDVIRGALKAGARQVHLDDQRWDFARRVLGGLRAGLQAVRRVRRPRVMVAGSERSVWRALLQDWRVEGVQRPDQHVILTQTRATAGRLNRAAQQSRLRARRIRRQGVDIQGTKFHGNDRIHFRNGHRDLGIRPGDLGTVVRATKSALTVTLDQGRRVLIPLTKCPKVTLGYAFAHADARDLKPKSVHALFEANDPDKEARSILNRSRETKVRVYTEEWNVGALSASMVNQAQQRRQESSRSESQHERGAEPDRQRPEASKDQGHEQSQ